MRGGREHEKVPRRIRTTEKCRGERTMQDFYADTQFSLKRSTHEGKRQEIGATTYRGEVRRERG